MRYANSAPFARLTAGILALTLAPEAAPVRFLPGTDALRPSLEGTGLEQLENRLDPAAGLEEPESYDRVVEDLSHWQEITLWDEIPRRPRGFVRTKRALLPWNHPLWETGIGIVDPRAMKRQNYADWYVLLSLQSGLYKEVKVDIREVEPHPALKTESVVTPDTVIVGSIRLREMEEGVRIDSIRGSELALERLPGALTLDPDEESLVGEMMEVVERKVADRFVSDREALILRDLHEPHYPLYQFEGIGVNRMLVQSVLSPTEVKKGFSVVGFPPGSWSEEKMARIIGPIDSLKRSREVPIKMADGPRVVPVTFLYLPEDGSVRLYTKEEKVAGLPRTEYLVARLVAKLMKSPPEGPTFEEFNRWNDPQVDRQPLHQMLIEAVEGNNALEGRAYRVRFLASAALAYDPDFEGVESLLRRFRIEPAFTVRADIVKHLFRRHDEHPDLRYTDPQKRRVWRAMAGLLTGSPSSEFPRDPHPLVRLYATRTAARFTLNDSDYLHGAMDALRMVANNKTEDRRVQGEARRMAGTLLHQWKQGGGVPIKLRLGAPLDPEAWVRGLKIRRFQGLYEVMPEGGQREVSERTRNALKLQPEKEVMTIAIPEAPVPSLLGNLFAHVDLVYEALDHRPKGARLWELMHPDERTSPEDAKRAARDLIGAWNEGKKDLALLHRKYVEPGEEKDWVALDESGRPVIPVVNAPLEVYKGLAEEDYTLLQVLIVRTQPDYILSVSSAEETELEGERVLALAM